jgi:single-strand DNA-binding protein
LTIGKHIVGWGILADFIESLGVRKGMSLFVEGALSYRSWDDQATGQKRYATDINMETFQLLTPRSQGQGGSPFPGSSAAQGSSYSRPSSDNGNASANYDNPPLAETEDDLPF